MGTRTISQTAREAGVSPDTLRYYERLGLLPRPPRTSSGYRTYDTDIARRIRFIKGAQRMGLRLQDTKDLLDVADRGACPCGHTRDLLARRLEDVDAEIARLRQLRGDLREMLAGLDDCPPATAGTWWCASEFRRKGGEPR